MDIHEKSFCLQLSGALVSLGATDENLIHKIQNEQENCKKCNIQM